MSPVDFELQHSTTPQPKLLDGECATRDWPMPAGGVWVPRPAADESHNWGTSTSGMPAYMEEQARRNRELREDMERAGCFDPEVETNPVAAAFTRLMTWSRN